MSNKRNRYIGARFTEKEKLYIRNIAKELKMTLSDLIRESVFSHLNFLEVNKGKLEKKEVIWITEEATSANK
ncbi:MAG: hypothetical protein ACFFDN_41155 [Candidatus Hodarchaeota archaeon]